MNMGGIHTGGRHSVPLKKPGDSITLVPFGDVHFGDRMFSNSTWRDFVDRYKNRKDVLFLGMGDYTDLMSSSERKAFAKASLDGFHDQSIEFIVDKFRRQVDEFSEAIGFMEGRLLGLVEGNHRLEGDWDGSRRVISSTEYLCELLGCDYCGCETIRTLNFSAGRMRTSFQIAAHHGAGGGTSKGGSLQRVVRWGQDTFPGVDIYLMGHNHDLAVTGMNGMTLAGNGKLRDKKQWYARTGSFVKTREDGQANYNVDAARGSNILGNIEFTLTLKRDTSKGGRGLYVDSSPALKS